MWDRFISYSTTTHTSVPCMRYVAIKCCVVLQDIVIILFWNTDMAVHSAHETKAGLALHPW
jgi:hypothetical protein